jgi:hypothetical protein
MSMHMGVLHTCCEHLRTPGPELEQTQEVQTR